jgi:hypothetical protein
VTMIPAGTQPPPELATSPSPITPAALRRLEGPGASQAESSTASLASFGLNPGGLNAAPMGPTAQELHPSARRLDSGQWDGKTGQLNHAQAAQPGSEVWVTVPVDKITTTGASSSVVPVYASTQGYVPRPGESRGSLPPGPAASVGKPY